jgi:hypothetical protein
MGGSRGVPRLLRVLAVVVGLSVVSTIAFVAPFGLPAIRALLATGAFGTLTVIGWLVTSSQDRSLRFSCSGFARQDASQRRYCLDRCLCAALLGCSRSVNRIGA